LVVTYKVGTTGDVPVTNGFIKLIKKAHSISTDRTENMTEVRDATDIPIIDRSPAIIVPVETNAKGEPPLRSLLSSRAHAQVKSFAYP
jgi:hypothetical protein